MSCTCSGWTFPGGLLGGHSEGERAGNNNRAERRGAPGLALSREPEAMKRSVEEGQACPCRRSLGARVVPRALTSPAQAVLTAFVPSEQRFFLVGTDVLSSGSKTVGRGMPGERGEAFLSQGGGETRRESLADGAGWLHLKHN